MTRATRTISLTLPIMASVLLISGCVRRTARFTTVPEGARLFLNHREVGRTPATVEFTYYGDYDVVYRLDGFETAKTHANIAAPWYQWFPLDFFTEVLWPGELHDHHDIPTYELTPMQPPSREQLVQRALEFRTQNLFEDPSAPPVGPPPTMSPAPPPAEGGREAPDEPAEPQASDSETDA